MRVPDVPVAVVGVVQVDRLSSLDGSPAPGARLAHRLGDGGGPQRPMCRPVPIPAPTRRASLGRATPALPERLAARLTAPVHGRHPWSPPTTPFVWFVTPPLWRGEKIFSTAGKAQLEYALEKRPYSPRANWFYHGGCPQPRSWSPQRPHCSRQQPGWWTPPVETPQSRQGSGQGSGGVWSLP